MKANELMIGDWVMHNGKPKRVDVIWGREVSLYDPEKTYGSIYSDKYSIEDVWPIPLTAEILERNGLRRKKEYEKYELSEGYVEIWCILHDSGEDGEKHNVIHIEDGRRCVPVHYHNTIAFVHEFQHALRLCGVDKEMSFDLWSN